MNTLTMLAGTGLLLVNGAALAQEPADPDVAPPVTADDTMTPADPMADDMMDPAPTGPETMDTMDPADPMADDTMVDETYPADPAATAAVDGATTFTDAEIESFAAAAVQIQALQGDEPTTQQQAAEIVAQSGIDAATFNTIGEAMRTDPALAERVQLAAAAQQGQPEG